MIGRCRAYCLRMRLRMYCSRTRIATNARIQPMPRQTAFLSKVVPEARGRDRHCVQPDVVSSAVRGLLSVPQASRLQVARLGRARSAASARRQVSICRRNRGAAWHWRQALQWRRRCDEGKSIGDAGAGRSLKSSESRMQSVPEGKQQGQRHRQTPLSGRDKRQKARVINIPEARVLSTLQRRGYSMCVTGFKSLSRRIRICCKCRRRIVFEPLRLRRRDPWHLCRMSLPQGRSSGLQPGNNAILNVWLVRLFLRRVVFPAGRVRRCRAYCLRMRLRMYCSRTRIATNARIQPMPRQTAFLSKVVPEPAFLSIVTGISLQRVSVRWILTVSAI